MLKSQKWALWMRFLKKGIWHNEVQTLWGQFWPYINIILSPQKHILWTFWGVLMIIIFGPKNWPNYVWASLYQVPFFMSLLHSPAVWLFDIWQIIGNSLKYVFSEYIQWITSPPMSHLVKLWLPNIYEGHHQDLGMTGMTQGWSEVKRDEGLGKTGTTWNDLRLSPMVQGSLHHPQWDFIRMFFFHLKSKAVYTT